MRDKNSFYWQPRHRSIMTPTELFFSDHGDKKLEAISQYDELGFTINELYEHFRARLMVDLKGNV